MATANERLQDILVTHAVGIERLKSGMVSRAQVVLDRAERDLIVLIRELLEEIPPAGRAASSAQLRRFEDALQTIRDQREETWARYQRRALRELRELAEDEAAFTVTALGRAIAIAEVEIVAPAIRRLRTATEAMPFQGRMLGDWFADLAAADQDRVLRALRQGWINNETVDDIVARVRGTRAARYQDGALGLTRRQAETVVRTAVTHFSAATHEEVWQANSDIIVGVRWVSVLDGRTTPVCQDRDGRVDPLPGNDLPKGARRLDPPGARPPAHPNCRSATVAVLGAAEVVGDRPYVTDTRTPEHRRVDFRRQAREQGVTVAEVREAWARNHIGTVPAKVTFDEWLRRQPAAFQDDVLGPTRAKLFRRGGLTLQAFVDHTGRRYTLAELRTRDAEAFRAAGVG